MVGKHKKDKWKEEARKERERENGVAWNDLII